MKLQKQKLPAAANTNKIGSASRSSSKYRGVTRSKNPINTMKLQKPNNKRSPSSKQKLPAAANTNKIGSVSRSSSKYRGVTRMDTLQRHTPLAGQDVGSGDSFQQVGQPGGIDQADIVWSKMQTLKEKYLQDMRDLYAMLTTRSQQRMPDEQLQKLNHYKTVLHRMLPYLVASKASLPKEFKQDTVEAFEKQIVSIMETFKWRKQLQQAQQQQGNLGQVQAVQQPQQASQILQPNTTNELSYD